MATCTAAETVANPLRARGVTDPEEIFSDPEIEAVVIAASSTSHTSLILAAIAAEKAVFCEKPMAETLEFDRRRKVGWPAPSGRLQPPLCARVSRSP
jgi:predicted dehydrogenase